MTDPLDRCPKCESDDPTVRERFRGPSGLPLGRCLHRWHTGCCWATLADNTELCGQHSVTLTTAQLRSLLMDAEQAIRSCNYWHDKHSAQVDELNSLRAEIQRLESLLRQG